MNKLILASGSPRRSQLLRNLGLKFEIITPLFDEKTEPVGSPRDYAERLACLKGRQVAEQVETGIILAADTIVVKEGRILGKPLRPDEARNMLQFLSGSSHQVITGLSLINALTGEEITDSETTTVFFRELDKEEIEYYINTEEPFDKAGGYGIQGLGALFIRGIEGCFYNVVGLPLARLNLMLKAMGINLMSDEW